MKKPVAKQMQTVGDLIEKMIDVLDMDWRIDPTANIRVDYNWSTFQDLNPTVQSKLCSKTVHLHFTIRPENAQHFETQDTVDMMSWLNGGGFPNANHN